MPSAKIRRSFSVLNLMKEVRHNRKRGSLEDLRALGTGIANKKQEEMLARNPGMNPLYARKIDWDSLVEAVDDRLQLQKMREGASPSFQVSDVSRHMTKESNSKTHSGDDTYPPTVAGTIFERELTPLRSKESLENMHKYADLKAAHLAQESGDRAAPRVQEWKSLARAAKNRFDLKVMSEKRDQPSSDTSASKV